LFPPPAFSTFFHFHFFNKYCIVLLCLSSFQMTAMAMTTATQLTNKKLDLGTVLGLAKTTILSGAKGGETG
jgi:hypothetical protein